MLTEELRMVLAAAGADLVGFGDLTAVENCALPRGAAVALALPLAVLSEIQEGPTASYYHAYHELNGKLNAIVTAGAEFLHSRGYAALAQTTKVVERQNDQRTALPHKTVALRAGLGWIGKSSLLVTAAYGGAVRISSLLTDAPLDCATPLAQGRCGTCQACMEACPAGAIRGRTWTAGLDRDELFDYVACMETAQGLMRSRVGMEADICGQCFVACPHTHAYLRRASSSS